MASARRSGERIALVTGWFSFDTAEVTGGDLLAARTVAAWLREASIPHQVAMAANFRGGAEVAWAEVDPATVSHVLFVCGPLAGVLAEQLFARFPDAVRVAAGVSVVDGTARLGPVEVVARDATGVARADLALGTGVRPVPVVGVVRSHDQPEYGDRQAHAEVHRHIDALMLGADVAPVELDTRLHPGEAHLCATPDQLLALLGRCDALVTTRLHGLVLGLRAGVPVLAVDPIRGGGKVSAQAQALGWPAVVSAEKAGTDELAGVLSWCLTPAARSLVPEAEARGQASLADSRSRLHTALGRSVLGPTGVALSDAGSQAGSRRDTRVL